jgi:FAD/FMN-containing dehydrogenase
LPDLSRLGLTHLSSEFDRRAGAEGPLRVFDLLQDHTIRVSWKTEVRAPLERIFSGAAFAPALAECEAIHQRVLRGRVFVALHMHAGDGNVHTNIPVNSDNYAMLQRANAAVARIMQVARDLERRDLRRARHRHHQARVPDRRRDRRVPAVQAH